MNNSFTDQIKHEVVGKIEGNVIELAAIIRMNGSIQIKNQQLSIKIKVAHGDLARKLYSIIKDRYGFVTEIIVRRNNKFNNNYTYEIIIIPQEGLNKFLKMLGILEKKYSIVFKIADHIYKSEEKEKSYLRGAFLGGGSVNDPHGEYHLEIRCDHQTHARDLKQLFLDFDLQARISEHKEKYVLYLKKFSEITKFLNIIGASNAQLKMENVQTMKEVKSNVNRKVNAETANLDKTVKAAMEQLADINLIARARGLDTLSESLQEIAELRQKNPYASYKELGELLDPPLSKSGVNHRLRRIKKIAQQLK